MSITSDRLREHFNHDVTDSAANEIDELEQQITKLREQVAAQAAVIEKFKSALTYVIEDLELRASLKEDEDERGVVDIGCGAYDQAKDALSIPTDSTQILDEVRRAERERVEKMILGELFDSTLRRNLISKIRAME